MTAFVIYVCALTIEDENIWALMSLLWKIEPRQGNWKQDRCMLFFIDHVELLSLTDTKGSAWFTLQYFAILMNAYLSCIFDLIVQANTFNLYSKGNRDIQ